MDERATGPPAISVRRMHDGEERAVRALAGRVFSRLESAFFSLPVQTLVVERDGHLVGAVVPKVFALPDKGWYGAIFWLMSDPQARGLGVGRRLVEATLEYFEEHGCREAFACVEGYNTSSSNLFTARGVTILSPREQLRRYGLLGTFTLWIKMFRLGGRCWALSLDTPRGNETRSSGTSMVDRHVTERLDLPISRVAGRMGGRTRAVDGSWCSVSHRGAIWPARSSDEVGGAAKDLVMVLCRRRLKIPVDRSSMAKKCTLLTPHRLSQEAASQVLVSVWHALFSTTLPLFAERNLCQA
jgi:ribosomal protein S18 acetylase RimI-like enzyme